jgi:hypothetical protein
MIASVTFFSSFREKRPNVRIPRWSAALKYLVEKVQGVRALAKNAKQAAQELVDQYGDSAMASISELEDRARGSRKFLEYFYWKLVREHIREIQKRPRKAK